MNLNAVDTRVKSEATASSTILAAQQAGSVAATFNQILMQAGSSLTIDTSTLMQARNNAERHETAEPVDRSDMRRRERAEQRDGDDNRTRADNDERPRRSSESTNRISESRSEGHRDDDPSESSTYDSSSSDSVKQDRDTTDGGSETTRADDGEADAETTAVADTESTSGEQETVTAAAEIAGVASVTTESQTGNSDDGAEIAAASTAQPEAETADDASGDIAPEIAKANRDMGHQSHRDGNAANLDAKSAAELDAAKPSSETASRQAADLAKAIGPNERMQVKVETTSVSESVVSQPSSTLSASAVMGGDGSAQTQNGQQNAHGQAQNGHSAPVNPEAVLAQAAQSSANQQAATSAQAGGAEVKPVTAVANQGVNMATAAPTGETALGSTGQTAETQQTVKTQATEAPRQAAFRQTVVDQVTVQISKAAADGLDHIKIQLRPASLGRIDVQIDMTQDGKVTAVVTADNKDTLNLLQRDAGSLAKALQDAGYETDSGSLTFNLRNGDGQKDSGEPQSPAPDPVLTRAQEEKSLDELLDPQSYKRPRSDKRIDIRA